MIARTQLAMPCGCFAWRMGGASGSVLCWYHVQVHGESWRACDCVAHRAEKRGLGAYDFVAELIERESLRGSAAPRDIATIGDGPTTERDLKCDCVWLRHRGEWRVESWCVTHCGADSEWKRRRQDERNERGW